MPFDITRLIAYRDLTFALNINIALHPCCFSTHLRQTWQVHQCQVQHVRAVYPKVDGEFADALVLPSNPERLLLDLAPYLVEFGETLVDVQELAPLAVRLCWRVRYGGVDKLENEWSPGDDTRTTREEVSANNPVRESKSGNMGEGE